MPKVTRSKPTPVTSVAFKLPLLRVISADVWAGFHVSMLAVAAQLNCSAGVAVALRSVNALQVNWNEVVAEAVVGAAGAAELTVFGASGCRPPTKTGGGNRKIATSGYLTSGPQSSVQTQPNTQPVNVPGATGRCMPSPEAAPAAISMISSGVSTNSAPFVVLKLSA